MDKVLVDGYIREIEQLLNYQIIPTAIIQLCSSYYCMLIRILCLHFPDGVYIADVNNQHPMKSISWKSNIISLKTKKPTNINNFSHSGISYATHIKLASTVKQQIFSIVNKENKNKYDAVFKCGGGGDGWNQMVSSHCYAIIFDRKQFETIPDQRYINAFEWELPKLPESIACNDSAYSKQYGLITLGMTRTNEKRFYRLDFDSNEYQQSYGWSWNVLKNVPAQSIQNYSCVTFENKFVIISDKMISIYDFDKDEWENNLSMLKYKRIDCGILYDDISSLIYVGGGSYDNLSSHIECYNIHQNKWFDDLPETWLSHKHYPILWNDHSILYIASAWNDGAEYLDLRQNAKMWTRVYINNMQSLSNVFGAKITMRRGDFRLVC